MPSHEWFLATDFDSNSELSTRGDSDDRSQFWRLNKNVNQFIFPYENRKLYFNFLQQIVIVL
jgi:hypothetical protein